MFKWNAQIILDSFQTLHDVDAGHANTTQREDAARLTASRFPSVDNILGDIHSKCEKVSIAA